MLFTGLTLWKAECSLNVGSSLRPMESRFRRRSLLEALRISAWKGPSSSTEVIEDARDIGVERIRDAELLSRGLRGLVGPNLAASSKNEELIEEDSLDGPADGYGATAVSRKCLRRVKQTPHHAHRRFSADGLGRKTSQPLVLSIFNRLDGPCPFPSGKICYQPLMAGLVVSSKLTCKMGCASSTYCLRWRMEDVVRVSGREEGGCSIRCVACYGFQI